MSKPESRLQSLRAAVLLAALSVLVVACGATQPSRDMLGSATEWPDHCSVGDERWQIAYHVDGEDDVLVVCDVGYKEIDGAQGTFDLYLPADVVAGDAIPAVVLVHGNDAIPAMTPIDEHWKRDQYQLGRIIAALGMVAVSFDYRGYRDHQTLIDAESDVADLLDVLEEQAASLMVDPANYCIWAVSGGGLPAAWAATQTQPTPRCVVTFSADLDANWAEDAGPIPHLAEAAPSFFVARGAADAGASSNAFVQRARELGIDVVVMEHPGGHGFESTEDAVQQGIVRAAIDFLEAHLRSGR